MKPWNRDSGVRSALLPESTTLVILLVVFFGAAAMVLAAVLAEPEKQLSTHDKPDVAYGPEDFPEFDFNPPLLPELNSDPKTGAESVFMVPPPPFSDEDNFPCSSCHEDEDVDLEPYELDYHEEIELSHGPSDRWCFDCHNPEERDVLRLSSGGTVPFSESHRLCGQCHGTIYRDWKQGIHGRRRGYWNGPKSYLLCAHCHDPHSPRPPPIQPLPPPIHPSFLAFDNGETR